MTKEQIYKKNQKSIKLVGIFTPIVFWVCIALAVVLFFVAINQSIQNVNEIYDMLDSKVYNDTEIAENYQYLIDKYGEWVIGTGTSGFTIHFVNFKKAIFSGAILSMAIASVVLAVCGCLFGKWILPMIKKKLENENQDMVNLTILQDK